MNQEQPTLTLYLGQQQMLGGLMGGSQSSAPAPAQTPAPTPPPNPNPTVQTGDNQLAADNASAQAKQKSAANSTLLTSPGSVTQSSAAIAKKTILGG